MRVIGMVSLCFVLLGFLTPRPAQAEYFHPWFNPAKGGSICYYRAYSKAFLKKNPNVKLTAISVERTSLASGITTNSKSNFVVTFGASTKNEGYEMHSYCRPKGAVLSCNVEADGGTFTLQRQGSGMVIKTRRIELEGMMKDLAIVSQTGKPTRSFTLRGSKWETCAAMFD